MDDAEEMDLSVFDSALLEECWEDERPPSTNPVDPPNAPNAGGSNSNTAQMMMMGSNNGVSGANSMTRLPSFEMNPTTAASVLADPNAVVDVQQLQHQQQQSIQQLAQNMASAAASYASGPISGAPNSDSTRPSNSPAQESIQMQPETSTIPLISTTTANIAPMQQMGVADTGIAATAASVPVATTTTSAAAPPIQPQQAALAPALTNINLLPLAFNALAAGVNLSQLFPTAVPDANATAAAAAAAAAMNTSVPVLPAAPAATVVPSMPPVPLHAPNPTMNQTNIAAPAPAPSNTSNKRSRGSSGRKRNNSGNDSPPFLLFDAPVELRHNFMESQRRAGLPVMQDNNSYHFGLAVNGFHPEQIASSATRPTPKLVDARHGDYGSKRLKNAKEQKRAQRITDLIEQLRCKMEADGWQVGMKSKLHTLSS